MLAFHEATSGELIDDEMKKRINGKIEEAMKSANEYAAASILEFKGKLDWVNTYRSDIRT
jgi:hypothetical protein